MQHRVYVGPHAEVELVEAGVLVRRGESVEVDADLAALLDEQPTNWAKPAAAKKTTRAPKPPAVPDVTLDGQPIEPDDAPEADS